MSLKLQAPFRRGRSFYNLGQRRTQASVGCSWPRERETKGLVHACPRSASEPTGEVSSSFSPGEEMVRAERGQEYYANGAPSHGKE